MLFKGTTNGMSMEENQSEPVLEDYSLIYLVYWELFPIDRAVRTLSKPTTGNDP